MANVFIEESTMQAIGDAIRSKTGKEEGILPADMPVEIENIQQAELYPANRAGAWVRFWDDAYLNAPIQVEAKETATSIVVIGSNNWLPLQDASKNNIYDNNNKFVVNNGYRLIDLGAFYPVQRYCFSVNKSTTPAGGKYLIEFYNNNTLVGSGVLELTSSSRSGVEVGNIENSFNKIRIYSGETIETAETATATFEAMCLYANTAEVATSSITLYYAPQVQRYELPQTNLKLSSAPPLRIVSNDNTPITVTYYHNGKNWDDFWDIYQTNGSRNSYGYGFYNTYWKRENFIPKYWESLGDGTLKSVDHIFAQNGANAIDYDLDFSNCTNFAYAFSSNINVRYIKSIKFNSAAEKKDYVFASCKYLVTISEIKGEIDFNLSLGAAVGLDNGTVSRIINALVPHKNDGITRTLTLHANVEAKMTPTQRAVLTDEKGWGLAT